MSCEELKELYELYVLGTLEAPERQELDEHLARRCPHCTPGVHQARQWIASLGYGAPPAEPPARLRQRVLASVGAGPQKAAGWSWLTHAWATVALGLLLAVLWYAYERNALRGEMQRLQAQMAQAQAEYAALATRNRMLNDALAFLNQPETRQLSFGGAEPAPPRGRVWVHPQRGVLLLASRLRPAGPGLTYEMWIVPKSGAPIPAGLFNSNAQGEAAHVWLQPVDVSRASAVAVTLEPEGGVPAPTSTPLIVAAF